MYFSNDFSVARVSLFLTGLELFTCMSLYVAEDVSTYANHTGGRQRVRQPVLDIVDSTRNYTMVSHASSCDSCTLEH